MPTRLERESKKEGKDEWDVEQRFRELNTAYDFKAIVQLLDSEDSGMYGESADSIRQLAAEAAEKMQRIVVSSDEFTGDILITSTLLREFGNGCQVFPYINYDGFFAIMGFPYEESLHYDLIYIKDKDGEVEECKRFKKNGGYSIQFEHLNGQAWEYSILDDYDIYTDSPVAISFREEDSVRSENYSMTPEEQTAFNDLYTIEKNRQEISTTITHWCVYGD